MDNTVPPYDALLWPSVQALRSLGGSGSLSEINERAVEQGDFTSEQQAILHGDGPRTEIEYRLAWARTHLRMMDLVDNSARGVWTLTESGRQVKESQIKELHVRARRKRQRERTDRRPVATVEDGRKNNGTETDNGPDDDGNWREQLLDAVMAMPPDGFERLAQRLLREAGFISVKVTGGSGDGGIDGLGLYRMSLVSFPIFFQCKRYRGNVPPSAVRDFRGAMAGRGDKGLLITTGTFSSEAKKEATRPGAPPIDLIDGEALCDLLKKHGLGVKTEIVEIESIKVEHRFFAEV